MKQSLSSKNGKNMGMISEMNAATQAKAYERMILDALFGGDWNDCRSAAKGFVRKHIVKKYYDECYESFSETPNPIIVKEFPLDSAWEEPKSDIISFYTGNGRDHKGRDFWMMIQSDNDEFEKCHDFIQWLFPLHEKSRMTDAPIPIITEGDRDKLVQNVTAKDRMWRAQYRFKLFLLQTGPDNWCTPKNHNLLRITRVIRSLRLFGLHDEAIQFHEACVNIARLHDIDEKTISYWDRALTEPLFDTLY